MNPEALAFVQGIYFFLTGVWPILHMRSFLAVTGPKTDLWLVKTVGALITVIGGVLVVAAVEADITLAVFLLAVGSSVALTAVDVIYVSNRTISRIYLLDAAVELVLIALWLSLYR